MVTWKIFLIHVTMILMTKIDVLKEILLKVKSGIVNNSLATLMDHHGDVVDEAGRYCSILTHSEIQTVDFWPWELSVVIDWRSMHVNYHSRKSRLRLWNFY